MWSMWFIRECSRCITKSNHAVKVIAVLLTWGLYCCAYSYTFLSNVLTYMHECVCACIHTYRNAYSCIATQMHAHNTPIHISKFRHPHINSLHNIWQSLLLTPQACVVLRLLQLALLFFQTPVLGDQMLNFGWELLNLRGETNLLLQAFCKKTVLLIPAAFVYKDLKKKVRLCSLLSWQ